MKFTAAVLTAAALVGSAHAHTRVFSYSVNGADQGSGAGKYIRQPPSNSPVKDLTSTDVRCNVGGTSAVPSFVKVKAGDTVEPEWFHDNRGDDIIDGSHVGPIVAYLAPAASNGQGNVWVKIAEDGFDGSQWAVTRLIKNKGKHSVKIPAGLAEGDYILRVEILALHESDTLFSQNSARGIQLYPSCGQISVSGGSTTLPAGVAFPGAYKDDTPGIKFNVYGADAKTYKIPGPAVWDGVTGGSAPAPSSSAAPVKSSAAPEPAPSTSVAPTPSSSKAPAPSSSKAAAPSSSKAAAPSSSKAAAPSSSKAPVPAPSTSVVPAPASSPATTIAAPAPTGGVKDANDCWRSYNACLDASQPKPDFTGCSATRDSCLNGARFMRLARSAKIGRAL